MANNLKWPRDEEEHVVLMNAWRNAKDRELMAHRIALQQQKKNLTDHYVYQRVLTRLLRNIQYPAEFE